MRKQFVADIVRATASVFLTLASVSAWAQSRTCIIDEQTGRHHCGWLADEQGYRIFDTAPAVVSPVMPPVYIDRTDNRTRRDIELEREREQRYAHEQQRVQIQEQVNGLFVEVLGRGADAVRLRTITAQVMEGRALSDVRLELATSGEARQAVNQIYREILRREADAAGMNAQISGLRSGMSLAQIRRGIADSPEARNKR